MLLFLTTDCMHHDYRHASHNLLCLFEHLKLKMAWRKLPSTQHSSELTSNMKFLLGEVIISNINLFEEWEEHHGAGVWGGGGGVGHAETWLCTLLQLSLLIKPVSHVDNRENGESAASARAWWRNSANSWPSSTPLWVSQAPVAMDTVSGSLLSAAVWLCSAFTLSTSGFLLQFKHDYLRSTLLCSNKLKRLSSCLI